MRFHKKTMPSPWLLRSKWKQRKFGKDISRFEMSEESQDLTMQIISGE